VKNIGTVRQEVSIDGSPVLAPADQLIFTGPGGTLLELQRRANGWVLLVDSQIVESYHPHEGRTILWKFTPAGLGTHQLRIKNIGESSQEVFIDGTPVEAPVGTTTFTGPGACLLEICKVYVGAGSPEGWALHVDGVFVPQCITTPVSQAGAHSWEFMLPNTGAHSVSATNLGMPGQQVFVDGAPLSAPEGTTTFTGPEGCLLQLVIEAERPFLYVDGVLVEESGAAAANASTTDAVWNFAVVDPSLTFSTMHQMRVTRIGVAGQEASLDGVVVPAPEGTTTFTGPGGCLLELKMDRGRWTLHVDGQNVEAHNASVNRTCAASAPPGVRQPVAPVTMTSLPQGVSMDQATGQYTANIRVHGRFVCLGQFASPEEASLRYQEEKRKQAG
jgi:hypothetical protein